MTTAPAPGTGTSPAIEIRLATEADLSGCAALWRDALNDYMGRLNLPLVPDELAPIGRLHAHLRATDPDLFRVAVDAAGEIVAGLSRICDTEQIASISALRGTRTAYWADRAL